MRVKVFQGFQEDNVTSQGIWEHVRIAEKDELWVVWFKESNLELLAISVASFLAQLCLLSISVCPVSKVSKF